MIDFWPTTKKFGDKKQKSGFTNDALKKHDELSARRKKIFQY